MVWIGYDGLMVGWMELSVEHHTVNADADANLINAMDRRPQSPHLAGWPLAVTVFLLMLMRNYSLDRPQYLDTESLGHGLLSCTVFRPVLYIYAITGNYMYICRVSSVLCCGVLWWLPGCRAARAELPFPGLVCLSVCLSVYLPRCRRLHGHRTDSHSLLAAADRYEDRQTQTDLLRCSCR